jgi:hypothetical protein
MGVVKLSHTPLCLVGTVLGREESSPLAHIIAGTANIALELQYDSEWIDSGEYDFSVTMLTRDYRDREGFRTYSYNQGITNSGKTV